MAPGAKSARGQMIAVASPTVASFSMTERTRVLNLPRLGVGADLKTGRGSLNPLEVTSQP